MTTKEFALVIGIEHYERSNGLPNVCFAENDVLEFCSCLINLGIPKENIRSLINEKATTYAITQSLKDITVFAKNESDRIFFFYAGHGGLDSEGRNYITCFDTNRKNPSETTIQLNYILNTLKESRSQQKIIFLDSCHSGMEASENMREFTEDKMNREEMEKSFSSTKYTVGFASCSTNQRSAASDRLSHGIWTYYLLKALRGEAQEAIVKGNRITCMSLQNYLAEEVPQAARDIRKIPEGETAQTPELFGKMTKEFTVFNLSNLFEKRKALTAKTLSKFKNITISGSNYIKVQDLSGFIKGRHKIFDKTSNSSRAFVASIGQEDRNKEGEKYFNSIRENFELRKKDFKLDMTSSDCFLLETKYFNFCMFYEQCENNSELCEKNYTADNFNDIKILSTQKFNHSFGEIFNTITFSHSLKIDFDKTIENLEENEVKVEYHPSNETSFCILFPDFPWKIRLNRSTLDVVLTNDHTTSSIEMWGHFKIAMDKMKEIHKYLM